MCSREVEKNTGISRTSVRRMIKRRGLKQFKRLKKITMSSGTQERRTKRAAALADRFRKCRSVEKWVWQDKKDFTLDVPLNSQNSRVYEFENKDNIQDNRLFHHTNRQSRKVMISACAKWKGATKRLFLNDKDLKVNSKTYKKHLEKELLPETNGIMNNNTWIFFQDNAPSHRANIVQDLLREKFGKRSIEHTEWPPSSPYCNPLDCNFWNKIKEKVYEDQFTQPFGNSNKLKIKIKKV